MRRPGDEPTDNTTNCGPLPWRRQTTANALANLSRPCHTTHATDALVHRPADSVSTRQLPVTFPADDDSRLTTATVDPVSHSWLAAAATADAWSTVSQITPANSTTVSVCFATTVTAKRPSHYGLGRDTSLRKMSTVCARRRIRRNWLHWCSGVSAASIVLEMLTSFFRSPASLQMYQLY